MPVAGSDIKLRLSGGTSNTDPNLSLGLGKSTTEVTDNTLNNLWDDVSGDESSPGDIEYRCVYVHNGHATLAILSGKVWVSSNSTSTADEVDIGLDLAGLNGTADDVANENTAPSPAVTFSHPTSKSTGLSIGNVPAGQHYAIWIRRTVDAAAGAKDNDTYILSAEGDTAE